MSGSGLSLDEKIEKVAGAYESVADAIDCFDPGDVLARRKARKIQDRLEYLDSLVSAYSRDYGNTEPFDNIRHHVGQKADEAGIYEQRPGLFRSIRDKFGGAECLKAFGKVMIPFSGFYYAWKVRCDDSYSEAHKQSAGWLFVGLELTKLVLLMHLVFYSATGKTVPDTPVDMMDSVRHHSVSRSVYGMKGAS